MTEQQRIDLYTSIVPNSRQITVQEMKFYAFIHYGINTFTRREWGDGTEDPKQFNPKEQDTDQWCEAIKAAGMKGVILTCKHHDGFCLWQTQTTEHSIKNSSYKGGKGDVVRELSDSCKKYGLKLGVYLSPWDRNSEYYSTDKYMDFYIRQETELLTNYGEIFMLWLDGACGAAKDGKEPQKYDFNRIWQTALKLQPNICISGCAPDVRWVGNESGVARESEWNVVPQFQYELQNIDENGCQNTDDMKKFQKRCTDCMVRDLGSRKFLADYEEFMWYPAEVDVSIMKGWFNHGKFDFSLKSLKRLMKIYYTSVGGNSLLLLNIPPNKQGLIDTKTVKRLKQLGDEIKRQEALVIDSKKTILKGGFEVEIKFSSQSVDRLLIEEDTTKSQRVEAFRVYCGEKRVYKGTIIGFGKIAIFDKPVQTDRLRLVIDECRNEPYLKKIDVVASGAYRLK